MNETFTEKNIPIQDNWLYLNFFVTIFFFLGFAHLAIQRKNFHYFFGTEFLVLKQDGIFLKKEWVIPYDTIKNLFVGAGPIERHIGLAFLDFESTSTQKKQKLFN